MSSKAPSKPTKSENELLLDTFAYAGTGRMTRAKRQEVVASVGGVAAAASSASSTATRKRPRKHIALQSEVIVQSNSAGPSVAVAASAAASGSMPSPAKRAAASTAAGPAPPATPPRATAGAGARQGGNTPQVTPPRPTHPVSPSSSTLRRASTAWRQARAGEATAPPHEHWAQQYNAITRMRADRTAVVDSMGTEALADRSAPPETQRFQTLVALMLSSQTKDEVTGAAVIRLQKHGLDAATLAGMSEQAISDIIYPVGFYRNKGKYLSKTAKICVEKYGGDIPRDVKGLCELPGVGPKMAYICVNAAWSECTGIGVDVHVHRISNRLKWVKGTKTPEETRAALEGWLPRPLWEEVNLLLVGFGQQTCNPRAPKCHECGCNDTCSTGKATMRSILAAERKAAAK